VFWAVCWEAVHVVAARESVETSATLRSSAGTRRLGRLWNGETQRYPLAVLAGLLWALAYPTPGIAGFAWLAPGLLLVSALGLGWKESFRVGYVAGLVQALVSLRWLLEMPHPAGALAGWLALSGYCALFPGLWVGLSTVLIAERSRHRAGIGETPLAIAVPQVGWRGAMEAYLSTPWIRRAGIPVAVAAVWVATEMLRSRLLTGFPWNPLGGSQWRQVPLVQMARVTGVYGLSFLVCWASVAFAGACVMVALRPRERWMWLAEARLPLFVVLACLGTGFYRVIEQRRADLSRPPRQLRLALVQPSIPQTLLWDPGERDRSFGVVSRLTDAALETRPDVLVWPEGDFGLDRERFQEVMGRFTGRPVTWVFSATDVSGEGPERAAYNAAFLGVEGSVVATYRKRRLVAFGEYVPLVRWLPFLKYLTPIGDGFAPGAAPVRFEVGGADGPAGASPVICFEDTFPHGVREHVGADVDFLLELTNDGWFGTSSAQWQHLANVVFRAVENDVAVVRCANNGISCWVDSLGLVRDVLGEGGPDVYRPGFRTVEVPVGTGRAGGTWYRRHGDVFGWGCVGYAAFAALGLAVRIRQGG
jgi:apolipoprotein N-acyltransferase